MSPRGWMRVCTRAASDVATINVILPYQARIAVIAARVRVWMKMSNTNETRYDQFRACSESSGNFTIGCIFNLTSNKK